MSPTQAQPIPVDYTISKSFLSLFGHHLTVHHAEGDVAYTVRDGFCVGRTPGRARTLFDALGSPVISAARRNDGAWEGFRGGRLDPQDSIFRARRKALSPFVVEMEVSLPSECSPCTFVLKGNPTRRSCTVYRGDSIAAQSSLMYKLRKVLYSTNKFRLTVYSGIDHAMAIALLVIFIWGADRYPCW